ncbi:MAG: O-antigen ligase family protein [Planctomycetaceae bacterium]
MSSVWNRSAASQLAFVLLLGCCAAMILRPAELFPVLDVLPIYECLILGALVCGVRELQRHFRWANLQQQPALLCVVGVLIAIVLSHLQRMYLHGAKEGAIEFLKVLLLFGLIISQTDTVSRLKTLLTVIALTATATVSLCVLDYYGVIDFEFITHISDVDGITDANELHRVSRMRGTGIFQDPNDISLLIVFSAVIWSSILLDRSVGPLRFGAMLPIVVLVIGLLCTKSRGGMMAAGASLLAIVLSHYGKKAAIIVGLVCLCAVPLVVGRQTGLGFSEGGTGHERITLWREGLAALRSPWLLFGIGQGMYADWAGLVAHNSFVHAYVELGIIGGTLFFGAFFFPMLSLYRLRTARHEFDHPELTRLFPFVVAMLVGWTMGLQSLSRAYVVSTYLMLGTQVSYLNLASAHLHPRRLLVSWDRPHLLRLATCSAAVFLAFNVFVVVVTKI